MKTQNLKLNVEHLILFVIFPLSLVFSFSIYIKLGLGFLALLYVLYISLKNKYFKSIKPLNKPHLKALFLKQFLTKFTIIVLSTGLITFIFYRENLFNAFQSGLGRYFILVGIYVFFSVIPQEFIYRKFYFQRYHNLFKNDTQLIIINTLVFCLGHLFFKNLLVLFITLIGGLIFSMSYKKFRSFKWICIEHSLYGLWLYTVGLGGLLGFPVN